jgi:hypothetical protein
MTWNLESKRVTGMYLGMFPYTGSVTESRVKYGGQVQHTVLVDQPIEVFGAIRNIVTVSSTEISKIIGTVPLRDVQLNDSWYEDQFNIEN